MSQPLNFTLPTKITSTTFHELLTAIFSTTVEDNDQQRNEFVDKWNDFNATKVSKPTFYQIKQHFGITVNPRNSDTMNMSKILEMIAKEVPAYENTWDMINVFRNHIVMQLKSQGHESEKEDNEEEFIEVPKKQRATTTVDIEKENETQLTSTNKYDILTETVEEEETEDQEDEKEDEEKNEKTVTSDITEQIVIVENEENMEDIITKIKEGKIMTLSIESINKYIQDESVKKVREHLKREKDSNEFKNLINEIINERIDNIANTKLNKFNNDINETINKQTNTSVESAITKFNQQTSVILARHENTIAESQDKMMQLIDEARTIKTKVETELELSQTKATQRYNEALKFGTATYTKRIAQETDEQKKLFQEFITQQGEEVHEKLELSRSGPSTPIPTNIQQEASPSYTSDSNSAIQRIQETIKIGRFATAARNMKEDEDRKQKEEQLGQYYDLQPGTIIKLKPPSRTNMIIMAKEVHDNTTIYKGTTTNGTDITVKPDHIDQIIEQPGESNNHQRHEDENDDEYEYEKKQRYQNNQRFAKGPEGTGFHRQIILSHNQFKLAG
jgi:hypothetical protein